jgi:hypothetical protein
VTQVLEGSKFRGNLTSESIFMKIQIPQFWQVCKLDRNFPFEVIEA